jgi:hypothetical protein
MKTETIAYCLQFTAESFQGKFTVTKNTPLVWRAALRDIPDDFGKAAVVQLCTSMEWPPSFGQIRQMAFNLAVGRVTPPSAFEAWEAVLQGRYDEIGSIGKRALDVIGGTHRIRTTESPSVDRAAFIRAYDDFSNRVRLEMAAIPEVKQLAEASKPAPPERLFPPPEDTDHAKLLGFTPATPETIRDAMKGLLSEHEARIMREVNSVKP